ncbi:MAG: hypothetical protein MI922_18670 [Bacteroidales bacterium]|nr:hypothetical protein [Bacteroidales bacterium]
MYNSKLPLEEKTPRSAYQPERLGYLFQPDGNASGIITTYLYAPCKGQLNHFIETFHHNPYRTLLKTKYILP